MPKLSFGIGGWMVAGLLCAHAGQQPAPAVIGWYNGDWQSGLPGQAVFFFTGRQFSRVYDDFVVPAGGWTVVGVFSNVRMESGTITKASWEIRRDMAPGKGGKKVASGVRAARQVQVPGAGPFARDPSIGYRIQVDGLHVRLKPGRYWLSVAPVGRGGPWFADATLGRNAIGDPPGNNGRALVTKTQFRMRFADAGTVSTPGQFGIAQDFSQGVIIETASGK